MTTLGDTDMSDIRYNWGHKFIHNCFLNCNSFISQQDLISKIPLPSILPHFPLITHFAERTMVSFGMRSSSFSVTSLNVSRQWSFINLHSCLRVCRASVWHSSVSCSALQYVSCTQTSLLKSVKHFNRTFCHVSPTTSSMRCS